VSVRVNFVLRPCVSSEEEWGCSRNSVRVPCLPSAFQGTERVGVDAGNALASVQGVFLSQGDRLFDESKIFVEQFLGLRAGRDRRSAIHRRHRKLYDHEGASHIGSVLGEGHRHGWSHEFRN
jgi:hypothetical protein